jgi:polyphosphate kinase
VGELFSGMNVLGATSFRVTRNSDLFVKRRGEGPAARRCRANLPQRHFGDAVRLEVADNMSEAMTPFLLSQFGLGGEDLYKVAGPVNLVRLMNIPSR